MAVCGAGNPDHPDADYRCEYPKDHDRIWRYGAWQDHGAPSQTVWWVVPPYAEEDLAAVSHVLGRTKGNPHLEALLASELTALGWRVDRPGSVSYGQHAPSRLTDPPARPEYRAAGYTVIEPTTP